MSDEKWKLVPTEPSLGMLKALMKSAGEQGKEFTVRWALGSFREDYQAMLAAAPDPTEPFRAEGSRPNDLRAMTTR